MTFTSAINEENTNLDLRISPHTKSFLQIQKESSQLREQRYLDLLELIVPASKVFEECRLLPHEVQSVSRTLLNVQEKLDEIGEDRGRIYRLFFLVSVSLTVKHCRVSLLKQAISRKEIAIANIFTYHSLYQKLTKNVQFLKFTKLRMTFCLL